MSPTPRSAGWNFADIWERHADRFADTVVQIQGERSFTWAEFDRRADGIAHTLLASGVAYQDKIAHYLYNAPEFLESMFGMYKAGLVPVNTNYRYTDDEIAYLWDNADAVGVVFHGSFTERCDNLRKRFPHMKAWIWVDDGGAPCPEWATAYETAAASAPTRVEGPWGRSPDDLFLLYTGGTTGSPKGVMWRQDDVIASLDSPSKRPLPDIPGWDVLDARVNKPGPRTVPVAPLMHGMGAFNAMWSLCLGGSVVTLQGRRYDAIELLDAIDRFRVANISLVGDAFAKPMLQALDAEPERWDISSLRAIVSSGVMWSSATKAGLLRHNPNLSLVDTLGSSEAIGMARNVTTAGDSRAKPATFALSAHTKVLTDDGREVVPGSGERGRVALRGRTPIGYYKDPEKSASTFVTFEGVRWSIPGDHAEVEADGTIRLLGRGSQCINTGGEKVYPEEVEEALKLHPSVADAAVIGLPDERFGEAITALVESGVDADFDEGELIAHVKQHLAAYKAPKRVLQVATIGRAANGKLDYVYLKSIAVERLTPASVTLPSPA
jgi:3-oxocholest-4-en-26-oate---CoA ligase